MCRSLKSSQDVTKFTSHRLGRTKLSLIIMLYWTGEITRLRLGPHIGKNKIVLPQRNSVKRQQKLKKKTLKKLKFVILKWRMIWDIIIPLQNL